MSILNVDNFGSNISHPAQSSKASDTSAGSVEKAFLDYIKESPGQRMVDAWLKAHHLTEEDLKNMPPQKREAIEKQMAEDIKNDTERKAKSGSIANL